MSGMIPLIPLTRRLARGPRSPCTRRGCGVIAAAVFSTSLVRSLVDHGCILLLYKPDSAVLGYGIGSASGATHVEDDALLTMVTTVGVGAAVERQRSHLSGLSVPPSAFSGWLPSLLTLASPRACAVAGACHSGDGKRGSHISPCGFLIGLPSVHCGSMDADGRGGAVHMDAYVFWSPGARVSKQYATIGPFPRPPFFACTDWKTSGAYASLAGVLRGGAVDTTGSSGPPPCLG